MEDSQLDFQLLGSEYKLLVGYKGITFHLIFDVKIDPILKAQSVGVGHITNISSFLTYSSAVSGDSVSIYFLVVTFN